MEKAHQFTAGELYAFRVLAAQAYDAMALPDVSQIAEQLMQEKPRRKQRESDL